MFTARTRLKLVKNYSIQVVKEESGYYDSTPKLNSDRDVFRTLKPMMKGLDREHFFVALLSTRNKLIGVSTVSIGSLASVTVHPREVFKTAIMSNAAAIILAHNHPSGDPWPSKQDLQITQRMIDAGEVLGIPVIDHLIFGDEYYSVRSNGDCLWRGWGAEA